MARSRSQPQAKITFEFGTYRFGLDFTKLKRLRYERLVTSHVTHIGPFFLVKTDLLFDREAARTLCRRLNEGAVGNLSRLRRP